MEDKAHRNPVFAHLTRNARWPSARATLWLAAGLILASLALTVFLMARVEEYLQSDFHPVSILAITSWGLHLIMPMVAAPVAAILTVHETHDQSFQLLRVTPGYSPGGAVRGLVLAALFRLRVPLVLMVTLSPLMMVEPYRSSKYWSNPDHGCYVFVSHEERVEMEVMFPPSAYDMCIELSDRRLLLRSFIFLLFPVGLWGATLFSAALAVWLALRWGRGWWPWVCLVGWPLCVMAVSILLGLGMVASISETLDALNPYRTTITFWPPSELYAVVPFSVVSYVLAWGVMRLARRWV